MPQDTQPPKSSILNQPLSVWAIAFACTVSFMGIGLVDPILPAISKELDATPSQTMLLFTSYLLITAVAMFFTSWVASRLGTKRTLIAGLVLIIVFAALAGTAGNVDTIIGFRAGWGLGNALFISTSLAAIVGASGGSGSAIVLYEAALGVGMALGPLLGGALGEVSWRGPFFGTAALMAIGFIAIATLLRKPAEKPVPVPISASLKALRNPTLRSLGITALFYNFGFFTILAYTPYPLEAAAAAQGREFGAHELGLVFFGWGLLLAITSVLVAPVLTRNFGLVKTLFAMLVLLTATLVVMAFSIGNLTALVWCVIVSGAFLGVVNTALTETVMEATDLPRQVASSTYSGIRFLGGAIAPAVSGPIAEAMGAESPYWFGAAALIVSIVVLGLSSKRLQQIGRPHETAQEEAQTISAGDAA
ncbi:MFS transporter [Gulosibacter sp. ACHW.36C]|uniref:MFS transporter n=1 Tax=Gulosibacter sediminis TaxID=1729695 RepID=A0ABY4MWR1_9MICO|nr:MFS transporter [Gulosibacter sediminis]UQN14562.1 MFS transporter [Gulosibacter sediminis]